MGTLLHLKCVRIRRRKWPELLHLPLFSVIIVVMIGMQAQLISCSGGVNPPRPYLFRDYGMPQAFTNSAHHAQLANLYHQKSSAPSPPPPSQYSDSEEVGSSEEEIQYTAPLILDIDDPEVKARWMGVTAQESYEDEQDDGDDDDREYFEEGSMSSSEFSSRSSAQQARSSLAKDDDKNHENTQASQSTTSSKNNGADESRGMLDNFKIMNPLSGFWSGAEDDTQAESAEIAELPQSDETPEFNYYEPSYDNSQYYYEPSEELHDKPLPKPMGRPKPKQKPKPMVKPSYKPPQKIIYKPPKASKPKLKPKPKPKLPKRKKRKKKKKPSYPPPMPPHYHYQPDKLSIISEKLSKLNPFNYVQIKPPQITITKTFDEPPHPMGPPRRRKKKPMKGKKPKPPKPPKLKPIKIKKPKPPPKPSSPSKKVIKPKKPMDETSPEFEFYFGNPFDGYSAEDFKGTAGQYDYRQGDDEEEEATDDDDEEEEEEDDDDEEEEEEEGDDYYNSGPMTVTHDQQEQTSAEEATQAATGDETEVEANAEEAEIVPLEDDEADYGQNGSLTGQAEGETATATTTDEREKSIFGWKRRRKHRPKKHRHKPARRPPNWKQYRPAPLLPEIPEGVHDAVLKVIKNVGFLPEYGKNEKYGGHNKIKGKFTKTRPITLHHGLLTEVLRRK